MIVEFDVRRDERGWTVFERTTGLIVVLGGSQQCGLAFMDADDLAHRLNRRRLDGRGSILQ